MILHLINKKVYVNVSSPHPHKTCDLRNAVRSCMGAGVSGCGWFMLLSRSYSTEVSDLQTGPSEVHIFLSDVIF